MANDSMKGLILGFLGGLVGTVAVILVLQDNLRDELVGTANAFFEAADYDDISLDMAIIRMAEKGETDRIVATYCVMLRTRLDYIRPAKIEDPELRTHVEKQRVEALELIAQLETEGRCLTKR